jgi:hypothetical protein
MSKPTPSPSQAVQVPPSNQTRGRPDGKPVEQVGIVGLGHMGEAFVRNLLADGSEDKFRCLT